MTRKQKRRSKKLLYGHKKTTVRWKLRTKHLIALCLRLAEEEAVYL
jgi:hypothetical protein